ncbi:MAG: hypothetical protein AAFR81_29495 [Chloroflexota bacterium]
MQGKRSIREILIRLIDNLDLLYDKHHELYIPYHIAYIELRGVLSKILGTRRGYGVNG